MKGKPVFTALSFTKNKHVIEIINKSMIVLFIASLVFHFYVVYYSVNLSIENINTNAFLKSASGIFIGAAFIMCYFVRLLHIFVLAGMFCVFKVYLGINASPVYCMTLALIPMMIYWGRDALLHYLVRVKYS